MAPLRPQTSTSQTFGDKAATFGQRRAPAPSSASSKKSGARKSHAVDADASMEISWVPSGSSSARDGGESKERSSKTCRKGVESFGAGLERGIEENTDLGDAERQGRTKRRQGGRSGSKNVFRRIDG